MSGRLAHYNDIHACDESWEKLFQKSGIEASDSPEWSLSLHDNHLVDGDNFHLLVFHDKSIESVFPFISRATSVAGIQITNIIPLTELYNTHSNILASHVNLDLLNLYLDKIDQEVPSWITLQMSRIIQGSPLYKSLSQLELSSRLYCAKLESAFSFFITLPDNYDQYLKQRSSKFRNFLKRAQKKLSNYNNYTIKTYLSPDDISNHYNEIINIENNSWKYRHGTAISNIKRQYSFYSNLLDKASKSGRAHVMILYIDEIAVAYNMGYILNDTYFYLKTSYDNQYKSFSPSTILRAELVKSLIDAGCKTLDFPGEPYEWEKQWADQIQTHRSYVFFRKTFMGFFIYLLFLIRNKLKSFKKSNNQFIDPKSIRTR